MNNSFKINSFLIKSKLIYKNIVLVVNHIYLRSLNNTTINRSIYLFKFAQNHFLNVIVIIIIVVDLKFKIIFTK